MVSLVVFLRVMIYACDKGDDSLYIRWVSVFGLVTKEHLRGVHSRNDRHSHMGIPIPTNLPKNILGKDRVHVGIEDHGGL